MRFLRSLFVVIGVVTTFGILAGVAALLFFSSRAPGVPAKTLLHLDLDRVLVEKFPEDPLSLLSLQTKGMTLRGVLTAIERAASDERVVGLVARVDSAGMGLATVQEVREAIAAFRAAGKSTFVHAETFGEFSTGNGAYYLAAGFDKIYLQPSGDVGLTGLLAQSFFVKGTLEKLAVKAQFDNREEYKGVKDIFSETEFTAPQRTAVTRVMESLSGQIVTGISEGRGLSESAVRDLMERGPLVAQDALDEKLVDELLYRDQVNGRVEAELGSEAETLSAAQYLSRVEVPEGDSTTVALIYGLGQIKRGHSRYSPFTETTAMGSRTIGSAFRAAVEDEEVQAILFRVDSPGGSYVASDTMWREVVRAREHGKPVIVSMGNVAGSGGYFVAAPADKIVAQPATITGSIGVAAGKMVIRGLWEKLGVTWDGISVNPNASFWSEVEEYSPEQWQRLKKLLDLIYEDFVTKVAEGRELSRDEVLQVAKGRIWTGQDARQRGLVDELGGYATAIKAVREVANIPADSRIVLKEFPARRSRLQLLTDHLLGRNEAYTGSEIGTLWNGWEVLGPLLPLFQTALEASRDEPLSMIPVRIR